MSGERQIPQASDLRRLAEALARFQVRYAMIGGTGMALLGFPRQTKDIDLLLPVDPENNARLLKALAELDTDAAAALDKRSLDEGFSTAMEGTLVVDLLFVAAGKRFEELAQHLQEVNILGAPMTTLDVDGMLATKRTGRESDIPDRGRLMMLKEALAKRAGGSKSEDG